MEVKQTFIDFLEVIPDGAVVINRQGFIIAVNQAAAMMFRYSSSSMLELHLNQLLPEDVREKHDQHLIKFFKYPGRRSMGNGLIFSAIRRDGSTFHVDIMLNQLELEGELYGIAIVRDYTLQKKAEDKIRLELEFEKRQALTDHLTGIMNRRAFTAQLQDEIEQLELQGTPFAVSFIDLDDFKEINDEHGHHFGDEVLQKIAELIRLHSRHTDYVARIGGDEFATIHPMISAEDAELMMQRLRSQLVSGIGHAELPVTLSIGLCQCDKPSELYTIEGIMARADKAMYQAKKEGKNAVVLAN
ncbi:sensor domain-containing diguanylate cyclase [Idiomarina sp. HP20-50]|uniref:GGDEF domain-containing protein n=1 Tax=Idiomarina sp. HP20-50 TaxID=3070813 RepID=UPI00294B833D|nr:sensor domain-containing diguanylate cyclase [Idiomarina sp. HP20-50]MDV6314856.1 sensor domain-containing diguanylate cyclase [Idiomarina sp. HP20-50]